MKTVTFTSALADTDAIKTSIATVAAPASYSGVALNGVIGAAAMVPARTVSVKTSANAGSYTGHAIVVTGTDPNGAVQTETLTLTATNGGETIVGIEPFKTVTSIAVPAQFDTGGAFEFGVRDVMCSTEPKAVRVNGAGDMKVGYEDGTTDTIVGIGAKETLLISPVKIYGDAATTATGISLLLA